MAKLRIFVTLLVITLFAEDFLTLGKPQKFKSISLKKTGQQQDGIVNCTKMCKESENDYDWLLDWLFYDDSDENCGYLCVISISDAIKQGLNGSATTTTTTTTQKPGGGGSGGIPVVVGNHTVNLTIHAIPTK